LIVIFCAVLNLVFTGCKKDFNGYYDTPVNLKGAIYEQLKSDPDFSEFVLVIDKFPELKQAINTSGLYTVFAPTNAAIKTYLAAKFPGKNSIADFNINVSADSVALNELVQMHILYNMYFEYDFNHAINTLIKPDPRGPSYSNDVYRYTTRYKDPVYPYFDKTYKLKRLVGRGNKALTVYSAAFLDKYDLRSDYQAFFGIAPSDFNVDEAQIIPGKKNIGAKNGVIHGVNTVLERLPFMDELLYQKNPDFYNLLDQFSVLLYDAASTRAQITTKQVPDSIFIKAYGAYYALFLQSDAYDYSFLCPTGNSFNDFITNQVLPGFYNSYDSINSVTSLLILNSYLVLSYANSTNLQHSLLNGVGDTLKNLTFVDKARASNGVLYMVNDQVLSPAFNSVAKVALLDYKYSMFTYLLALTTSNGYLQFVLNKIDYLKNPNRSFTLVIPSNSAFTDAGITFQKDYKGVYDFWQGGLKLVQNQKDSIINSLIVPDNSISPGQMTYKWALTTCGTYMLFNDGKIQGVNYVTDELTGNGYAYTTDELPKRPSTPIKAIIGGRAGYSIFVDSILSVQTWNGSQTFKDLLGTVDGVNTFTVLMPSDALLNQYKSDHARGPFSKDTIWRNIAAYHIITTKIFSDGAFQRKPGNPIVGDDSKFATLYATDVYNSIFIRDLYAWVQLDFNAKTVTSENGVQANILSSPFLDIQGANGVIEAVDQILVPPTRIYH